MSGWDEADQRAHLRAIEQQIADARVALATAKRSGDGAEDYRLRSMMRNLQRERRSILEGLGEWPEARRCGKGAGE